MRPPPPTVSYFPGVGLTVTSILPRSVAAMAQPTGEKGAFPGPRKGASAEGVLELERGQKGGNGDTTTLCRLDCSVVRSRLEGESCFLCRPPPARSGVLNLIRVKSGDILERNSALCLFFVFETMRILRLLIAAGKIGEFPPPPLFGGKTLSLSFVLPTCRWPSPDRRSVGP